MFDIHGAATAKTANMISLIFIETSLIIWKSSKTLFEDIHLYYFPVTDSTVCVTEEIQIVC